MIQKFEQFINESHAGGVFDLLREPVYAFIERAQERMKIDEKRRDSVEKSKTATREKKKEKKRRKDDDD